MLRYALVLALAVLSLSCASSGSTGEEAPNPEPAPAVESGQHTVVYAVDCTAIWGTCGTWVNPKLSPLGWQAEDRGDTLLVGSAEYATTCDHGQMVGLELSRGLTSEIDGRIRGSISIDGRVVTKGRVSRVAGQPTQRLTLWATCE